MVGHVACDRFLFLPFGASLFALEHFVMTGTGRPTSVMLPTVRGGVRKSVWLLHF